MPDYRMNGGMKQALCLVMAATLMGSSPLYGRDGMPNEARQQIPRGYKVISFARMAAFGRQFYVVALAARDEERRRSANLSAPPRPLIILEESQSHRFKLIARNDNILPKFDDGGISGDDPFHGLAAKGSYFTVETGVSTTIHWIDYITFRFDRRSNGFVFDNRRSESWDTNPSNDPNAEVLVSNGMRVEKAKYPLVPFNRWRP